MEQTLEQAKADAAASPAAQTAQAAQPHAPVSDIWLSCDDAKEEDLPLLGEPLDESKAFLNTLWHFFRAVPFGAALPDVTFEQLCVPPSFAHTLIGDRLRSVLWRVRQGHISGAHLVPRSALHLVKHAVGKLEAQVETSAEQAEVAQIRMARVKERGAPY